MYDFDLGNNLSIKQLEPDNQKEIWLANELDKDKNVTKYLWSIREDLEKMKYKRVMDPYDLSYVLYYSERPIGYFCFSHIREWHRNMNREHVYASYALLKGERKKGYATNALKSSSKMMLTNSIDKVVLSIEPQNVSSQNVATNAGFIIRKEEKIEDYLHFEKTEEILERELVLH